MTPSERRQLVAQILDQRNEALRQIERNGVVIDLVTQHVEEMASIVRATAAAIKASNVLQREMIDGILAANNAALKLHNDDAAE